MVLDDCSIDILIHYNDKIRRLPVNDKLARFNTYYLIGQISQDIIVIKTLIHNISGVIMCEIADWSL